MKKRYRSLVFGARKSKFMSHVDLVNASLSSPSEVRGLTVFSASHLSLTLESIIHVAATFAYSCHHLRMKHVYTFLVPSKGNYLLEGRVNLCFAAGARFV
jgi:hypothetical protein